MAKKPPSAPVVASLTGSSMGSAAAAAETEVKAVVASLDGTTASASGSSYYDTMLLSSEDKNPYGGFRSSADSFSSGHAEPKFNVTYGGAEGIKKKNEEESSYHKMAKKLAAERAERDRIVAYQNAVDEKMTLMTMFNNSYDHETGTWTMDANAYNGQMVGLNQRINELASNKQEEFFINHGTV